MDRAATTASSLHFAGFTLDQARACLRGTDGAEIALRPKAFDLLLFLARNAGGTVGKDALLEAVWPGVHVGDDSLFQAVREARRAIGDEAGAILRSVPKRGYMLDAVVRQAGEAREAAPTLEPPADRPSLVVLPFANVGGDSAQAYFADGVTDEITLALSRFHSFLVIARGSAFTFKDRHLDVREVGRVLGVRYVLEGSVRRAGERLRISGQLVEASTGAHLWADRFEGTVDDLFVLQDRVTEAVAAALEPRIQQAEIERALRKPTTSLSAYDLYLRALPHVYPWTAADAAIAGPLLEEAVARDPKFARAYVTLGYAIMHAIFPGWQADYRAAQVRSQELARHALSLDSSDPLILARAGWLLSMPNGEIELGKSLLSRAMQLGPNLVEAWVRAGWVWLWIGELETAAMRLARAERLDPLAPTIVATWTAQGAVHFFARRPDAAVPILRRAIARAPTYAPPRVYLAVTLVQLGLLDAAKAEAQALLAVQPNRTVRRTRETNPYQPGWMRSLLYDSMRQAGIPEE